MHTVAAVIDQGALTFDLAIPCEIFGLDRSDIASPWYRFLVVAAGDSPVRTQTGFDLSTPYTLRHLDEAETIVVPGWSDPNDLPSNALCDALRAAHARGARVVSLCTGAFVLAEAGLLAGRLVMPPFRAGGQAQYADNPIATDGLGEPLSAVLDWARDRLGAGITTADLAGRAAMSPRTLTRRFH